MISKFLMRWISVCVSLILLLGSTTPAFQVNRSALAGTSAVIANYLPIAWRNFPWSSPFGAEVGKAITPESLLLYRAAAIPAKTIRLNNRVSWRDLQPNESDPIQWNILTGFESELRALQSVNITPIVIINEYPAWATTTRSNGDPSYCGPLRSDKFQAFADFVSQFVNRYKTREFNVHVWELGNEPDIDGDLFSLPLDSEYGCWGDATDANYGGQVYGEMLKIVTPAIKAADPLAQVWVGGLLLDNPNTTEPGRGRPELFLRGILQAGIGTDFSYFDVVPYHAYTFYNQKETDYDNADTRSPWVTDPVWGGIIRGKARFLKQLMNEVGVQKPVFVNEMSLTCPDSDSRCIPPAEDFFQMQANHLVRAQVRGLDEGIMGFTWYTLDGPNWRYCGLLDEADNPRPSYLAYQVLAQQLINADYEHPAPVDYGAGLEAYAFQRGTQLVHVVWSELDLPNLTILVPQGNFIEARTRDGTVIAPVLIDGNYQIPVGYSPTYVIRKP